LASASRTYFPVRVIACFLLTSVSLFGIAGLFPSLNASIDAFAKGRPALEAVRELAWEWPKWPLGSDHEPHQDR